MSLQSRRRDCSRKDYKRLALTSAALLVTVSLMACTTPSEVISSSQVDKQVDKQVAQQDAQQDVPEQDVISSNCSSYANPLLSSGIWNQTAKTYVAAPRSWCEDGEWLSVAPGGGINMSIASDPHGNDIKLKAIELPPSQDFLPDSFIKLVYYQLPPRPEPRPGERLRPYDPVVECKMLLPGDSFTFPPYVGSVYIATQTQVSGSQSMPRCKKADEVPLEDRLTAPNFIFKVAVDPASGMGDPKAIVTVY